MKNISKINNNINQFEFKKFFEDFYPILVIFANKFLKDLGKAEDVVQDCFIHYYEKNMTMEDTERAKSYLYSTAKNKCLNIIRHNNIRKQYNEIIIEETDLFYREKLIENEIYSMLFKAIKRLPERTGSVVDLMLRGYKSNEIAEELNISVNTVKNLKHMAIKKLRLSMEEFIFLLSVFKKKD